MGQVSRASGSGYCPSARLLSIKLNSALASRPKILPCQQGFNSLSVVNNKLLLLPIWVRLYRPN